MTQRAVDIEVVTLGERDITIEEFVAVARHRARVEFAPAYVDRVRHSRKLIERFLAENRLVYGVTTGFGDNVTEVISPEDAEALQRQTPGPGSRFPKKTIEGADLALFHGNLARAVPVHLGDARDITPMGDPKAAIRAAGDAVDVRLVHPVRHAPIPPNHWALRLGGRNREEG